MPSEGRMVSTVPFMHTRRMKSRNDIEMIATCFLLIQI